MVDTKKARPRVAVVGAGFGGLFATQALKRTDVDIVLIDRQNYHLFQPLLYQVGTAGLAPSDIAWPVRSILRRQSNVRVLLGEVSRVDRDRRVLICGSQAIPFDYLVVATGAQDAYFGHDEWREHAPGLKTVDDATSLRRRLLLAFERAETARDRQDREALMRFVVIGAGPTGVELAGAVAELARFTLARDFRQIDPTTAEVLLVEAGPRVLPAFHATSSRYAQRVLQRLGVHLRLNTRVSAVDAAGVNFGTERVPAATTIWAAGVAATPVAEWLGIPANGDGRIPVRPDLSIGDDERIFVIGDAAAVVDGRGQPVPGIAPAAKQQGRHAARVIRQRIAGQTATLAFRYRHAGSLATIGRRAAVVEFGRFRLRGRLAWWLWGIAHIYFLIGLPSPLIVSLRWLWEYLTYGRGARLITGASE